MPQVNDYLSQSEINTVIKCSPSAEHALSVLNSLCRARGWNGGDFLYDGVYTKTYGWPTSGGTKVGTMNQIPPEYWGRSGYAYTNIEEPPKFLKQPYKHLYETDFMFL